MVESPKERHRRYEAASYRMENWRDVLEDAYKYAAPTRANWRNENPGRRKTNYVFDATAIDGLRRFANNIQSMMMPPFKRWAKLVPGPMVKKQVGANEYKEIENALSEITETIFHYIDKSNFSMVATESLQDMGISTGVMIVNEVSDEMPLVFSSVPIDKLCVEGGPNGTIDNYWRKWKLPLRHVKRYWPNASLPSNLLGSEKRNPDQLIELVEGTIFYPENDDNSKYYYYVSLEDSSEDIYSAWMSETPWIGFRMNRSTDEILGTGPVIILLPFIKQVNKMAEFELRAAKSRAYPTYLAADTGIVNPYNMILEPGSIVPMKPSFLDNSPIQALPNTGDPRFMQLDLQKLQALIREGLFADPLGPVDNTMQSKVEVSIRQQNWLRQNAVSVGRLTTELLSQVINKVVAILGRRGLIQIPKIDGKFIDVEYQSPLINLQDDEDYSNLLKYIQFVQETTGPQGLPFALKMNEVKDWVADKLGVDPKLVPSEQEMALMAQAQQQMAAQQRGQTEE